MAGRLPLLLLAAALLVLATAAQEPIWKQFLSLPDSALARDQLQELQSRPHLAGTPGDLWTAQYVASQFQGFGLDVTNATFDVYLPFPVRARLRGLPPFQFEAVLKETAYPEVLGREGILKRGE